MARQIRPLTPVARIEEIKADVWGQDHVTNELGIRVTAEVWGPGHPMERRTGRLHEPAYPCVAGVVRFGLDGQP